MYLIYHLLIEYFTRRYISTADPPEQGRVAASGHRAGQWSASSSVRAAGPGRAARRRARSQSAVPTPLCYARAHWTRPSYWTPVHTHALTQFTT